MQCRIACMAMVCKYYGRIYLCEKLSHICAMTNEGVSMQALKQLAKSLGFNVLCSWNLLLRFMKRRWMKNLKRNARLICKCSANRKFMKTAEIKKVEKISNPLISDDHFLQIKVISIYANYKVEYFLMLRNIVFMQKNLRTVFVLHIFVANY